MKKIDLDYNFGVKRFRAANPTVQVLSVEEDYCAEDGKGYFDWVEVADSVEVSEFIRSCADPRYTAEMEAAAYPPHH